jgi:hypothetical protein
MSVTNPSQVTHPAPMPPAAPGTRPIRAARSGPAIVPIWVGARRPHRTVDGPFSAEEDAS